MRERMSTISCNWHRLHVLLTAVFTLIILAGCATVGNYGKLDRSRDLDNMFLNYEVLPEHRYYTSGGYDAPDAILAIHSDYVLDNPGNLWVAIPNVDYNQMRKWIDTLAPEQNYRHTNSYFASYILDPEGKRVGAWYSVELYTTVRFLGDNRIQVYTPDLKPDMNIRRNFIKGGI